MLRRFSEWVAMRESAGGQYWGPFSLAQKDGEFLRITADMLDEPLYIPLKGGVAYTDKYPLDRRLSPPWVKYFEYQPDAEGRNVVTHVENRAVDCVCYSPTHDAVYLINRNAPPQGLALPGGFFDMQDGIDPHSPPDPASVGANAAARELKEETGADIGPSQLSFVGRFSTGKSDTREKNFFVWAYFYTVPDRDMQSFRFGDDASQAPGSPELASKGLKGWYKVGDVPRLAFPHHLQILAAAAAKMRAQQLKQSAHIATSEVQT